MHEASFSFFFLSLGAAATQILSRATVQGTTTSHHCSTPSPIHLCRVMSLCAWTRSRTKALHLSLGLLFSLPFWIHFHHRRAFSLILLALFFTRNSSSTHHLEAPFRTVNAHRPLLTSLDTPTSSTGTQGAMRGLVALAGFVLLGTCIHYYGIGPGLKLESCRKEGKSTPTLGLLAPRRE